jgi:DNA-binding response OmpR family regulator
MGGPTRRGEVSGGDLRRAVVIEDDDEIRSLITDILERAGIRVVGASNGPEGVARVRESDPIIVTVDIRMPGIDGFETTRRIRAISDAFILVLSASAAPGDEYESLLAGADAFMSKPFRPRDLRAIVHSRLRALDDA